MPEHDCQILACDCLIYRALTHCALRALTSIDFRQRVAQKEHTDLDEVIRVFLLDSCCEVAKPGSPGEVARETPHLACLLANESQHKMVFGRPRHVFDLRVCQSVRLEAQFLTYYRSRKLFVPGKVESAFTVRARTKFPNVMKENRDFQQVPFGNAINRIGERRMGLVPHM